jgi:hypothetical protein
MSVALQDTGIAPDGRGARPVPLEAATYGDLWPLLRHRFDPVLVPDAHHAWLQRMLAAIPRDAARYLGFEARLGEAQGATDCALSLTAAGAAMLAERPDAFVCIPGDAAWRKLSGFLRLWRDSHDAPFADAACVWLEFDMAGSAILPNLLFGYWPRELQSRRGRAWLLDQAIPTVLGGALPRALRSGIDTALDACPACTDFQIGLMCARPVPVVRICVFDLPNAKLNDYLAALRWGGDAGLLRNYLDAFRPHADFVSLHFDIGEKVYPHVGVEPGFTASAWDRQPHREPRWRGQFDLLEHAGLLTAAKRRALEAWPGHQQMTQDGEPVVLLRGLSHVKLVLRPDGRHEAKAYFGIAERSRARLSPPREVADAAGD